ncbi:MAG: hypothetical protein MUP70_16180 [Candidatus Aminicenantes bacterium]|nr:hypothetical protein [Candidatus Aminicenantes bacterium]
MCFISAVIWAEIYADITPLVTSPGAYDVYFVFDEGAVGLNIIEVAVLSGSDIETAEVVDVHRRSYHVGRFERIHDYWIDIPDVTRCFLWATVAHPESGAPSGRRATSGRILFRRSWSCQAVASVKQ